MRGKKEKNHSLKRYRTPKVLLRDGSKIDSSLNIEMNMRGESREELHATSAIFNAIIAEFCFHFLKIRDASKIEYMISTDRIYERLL